ncbi:hypothetical protein RHMOL_Rhmol03G0231900 [Rhododendron molle]|uniref:Uncharacterized protein n=1 Tax=Rhododendron molle TaxID=49168 RepID=A0ACC0PIS2_RHOML|nr:hypothetical protein RHMOL_Rhmol03G0231900 [Rhododendron molle]
MSHVVIIVNFGVPVAKTRYISEPLLEILRQSSRSWICRLQLRIHQSEDRSGDEHPMILHLQGFTTVIRWQVMSSFQNKRKTKPTHLRHNLMITSNRAQKSLLSLDKRRKKIENDIRLSSFLWSSKGWHESSSSKEPAVNGEVLQEDRERCSTVRLLVVREGVAEGHKLGFRSSPGRNSPNLGRTSEYSIVQIYSQTLRRKNSNSILCAKGL